MIASRTRTADLLAIRDLVENYAGDGPRLLRKNTVTLYEDVQEFYVAEQDATDFTDFVRFKLGIDDYSGVSVDEVLK